MEKQLLTFVDQIITVNEPLQNYFKSIGKKPITIIMNCKEVVSHEYIPPNTKEFTIVYIGVLNASRMFPELVDIIGSIDKVKFLIAGKKENLYEEVKKWCKNYSNIDFLGPIPYNEVIPKTLTSDVVICMISPHDPNNKIALANKQFEAMVCGRPIICTKETYAGKLIEKLQCGLLVDYTKESVKNIIITLRDNPGLCKQLGINALSAAITQYNWGNEKEKLIALYGALLENDTKT
jgi:glycosyltransferase involved in cell wall biosynthesis